MHKRRAYLEDLRTKLKTLTGFGGVWIQRIGPSRTMFPSITLYADQETVETETIHAPNRPQDRVLTISINAWIRGTADDEKAESDMDDAAVSIEGIITKPTGTDDIILVSTDFNISEEEPEIHVITLTYKLQYQSTELSPAA